MYLLQNLSVILQIIWKLILIGISSIILYAVFTSIYNTIKGKNDKE